MESKVTVIEISKESEKMYFRHIKSIAQHLRSADVDEIRAITDDPIEDVVFRSYDRSIKKWIVIKYDGTLFIPIAILGVMEDVNDKSIGVPWMVATDDARSISRYIRDNSKKYVDIMMEMFNGLYNYVDSRNKQYIKWLRWCGFIIDDAIPIWKNQVPFHRFHMGAVECVQLKQQS